MTRPRRKFISETSLALMGVPKRFVHCTLDDFNTYDKLNLAKVKSIVENYISDINNNISNGYGLCFIGSNGVGKSMLSCIILRVAYEYRFSCQRVSFSTYISSYTDSWGVNKSERDELETLLYEKYKGVELLVLEEIGKEIDSKIAKPILEDLLRYREEQSLSTIICTNLTPNVIKEYYGSSVVSLINGNNKVIKVEGEDRRSI